MISEVYNDDCMDGMKRYPDKFFDLAVVDPPYGVAYARGKNGWGVNSNRPTLEDVKWDNKTPNQDYFAELFRVSKNQIIWGGNYFTDKIPVSKCWIVWNKVNTTENKSVFADAELAWTSFTKVVKMFTLRTMGFISDTNDQTRIHPTQKPTELYEWILKNYSTCKTCHNNGGFYEDVVGDGGSKMYVECENCDIAETKSIKILDTHMGSQSSRIACYKNGFDFYGWEIDKDYFDAGNKRFNDFKAQGVLF